MYSKTKTLALCATMLVCLFCCTGHSSAAAKKKVIGYGWEFIVTYPTSVKQHIKEINASPFDGIAFGFQAVGDRSNMLAGYETISENWKWDRSWFAGVVKDLKVCAATSPKMKESFLMAWFIPNMDFPWADDDYWDKVANNFGIAAWIAKQAHMKGIEFDPEDYHAHRAFKYNPADGDFDTMAKLARKRGAQIMRAMAREYPEITLLSFWLMSYNQDALESPDPAAVVKESGSLFPAFVNGMLDALPARATMIDGVEHGYYNEGDWFARERKIVKENALALVAPENREKYKNQVQVGFGMWIDMYVHPPSSPWYFGPLDGSRARRLEKNLTDALTAADEYVWIYSERGCWWHNEGLFKDVDYSKCPLWEDLCPGVSDAIRTGRKKASVP